METKSDSPIIKKNDDGLFQLLDDNHHTLETKVAQRGLAIFAPFFEDPEQRTFKEDLTYVQLLELVKKLNRRLQRKGLPEVQTSNKFDQFVQQRQYYIKEQSQAGLTINYESLQSKLNIINDLLDSKTMLVFDEVHRVKGVGGQRAKAALSLSQTPHYRYVLTGTPIPNGFRDIYNFLHLMYPDEYSSFFAWDLTTLNNIDPEDVNKKLSPFFWRTNKKDLHVPKPDPDIIKEVEPSKNQQMLSQAIYETENGTLATFIRLLQASTNPELLATNINYKELGLVDADSGVWDKQASTVEKENASSGDAYKKYDLAKVESPKFEMGIDLIDKLVSQGKKVLVWGMFVGTMQKITDTLNDMGIKTTLVYGATPKQDREGMINNFRTGDAQVLVSNPNTLGESISLHQTVHDAVYFEYNFNLTFMLQSRDRINRLGLPANQYTRYYYLMTKGDVAHMGFIDSTVYKKLKDKEKVMIDAIDGQLLVPEYTDDYLQEVKDIVMGRYK